jgi:hypothetical protein
MHTLLPSNNLPSKAVDSDVRPPTPRPMELFDTKEPCGILREEIVDSTEDECVECIVHVLFAVGFTAFELLLILLRILYFTHVLCTIFLAHEALQNLPVYVVFRHLCAWLFIVAFVVRLMLFGGVAKALVFALTVCKFVWF